MFTNDLKKGEHIRLRNGWDATIEDNMKGNTRLCTVYGLYTEMGSVYSHDIMYVYSGGKGKSIEEAKTTCSMVKVEHTPQQEALRQRVNAMGF
jgi:hypothetical protein